MLKNTQLKMTMNRISKRRNVRRGAVLVEMALTIGLAFFFFFAALEFCRISMIRHSVENALYEGARAGIVPGATAGEVQNRARNVLRTVGLSNTNVEVTPSVITQSTRDVSVRIRLPLDQNLFAPAFFFRGRTLDRTLTMQREGSN
jgi:Flp pilus assembly protein TadG